jgi:serine/threonine-protein kinase
MESRRCSQGHNNPSSSRFCQYCGEPLVGLSIQPTTVLGERYQIVKQLGRGGFGRTYLAQDLNRFQELCVLKEFAPQTRGTYQQQKAKELFEREAGILYQLNHSQIPRFRELFRATKEEQGTLFLVQDYVEGKSYEQLLAERVQAGQTFSEAEIRQLLRSVLPVLEYIHNCGVIHRDISPDNILQRQIDGLPVLIDFGGVKQVAAQIDSEVTTSGKTSVCQQPPTRLGKVGFAPEEQIQTGSVYPHSDLYALAVTSLVLLTGKEPQELLDSHTLKWVWQENGNTTVSEELAAILEQMLAIKPNDRIASAREVLQQLMTISSPSQGESAIANAETLLSTPPTPQESQNSTENQNGHSNTKNQNGHQKTENAVPSMPPALPTTNNRRPRRLLWGGLLAAVIVVPLSASLGWWVTWQWLQRNSSTEEQSGSSQPSPSPLFPPKDFQTNRDSEAPPLSLELSEAERKRKIALRERRRELGIDYSLFASMVDQAFYARFPQQQGRQLTDEPEDKLWRERWDREAEVLLDLLETLRSDSLEKIGDYQASDREAWKPRINELHVSSRAWFDLVDARFFHYFPNLRQQNLLETPLGQVWHAIAFDLLHKLESRQNLETIQFEGNIFTQEVSAELEPGEGKVYVAFLQEGQGMRLYLESNGFTLLSIYTPSGRRNLLEDSSKYRWSGTLPESGYYEIVVVSNDRQSLSYDLQLSVDRVSQTSAYEKS